MEVVKAAGITWKLVRTWPGGRDRERAIKDRHEAPRLCPECSPQPRPVSTGRSALLAITTPSVVIEPSPQPQVSPYERGMRQGEQFIGQRMGCTDEQIIDTFQYVTGPFRDKTYHTTAEREWFRGYSEPVIRHLAQVRMEIPAWLLAQTASAPLMMAGGTR